MHNCPICGEKTEGSYSEGGIHFAVCEQCYVERYQNEEEEPIELSGEIPEERRRKEKKL